MFAVQSQILASAPDLDALGPDSPLEISSSAEVEETILSDAHDTQPAKITPVPTHQPTGWTYIRPALGDEPTGLLEIWRVDSVSFEFRLSHWSSGKVPCEVTGVAGRIGKKFLWRRIFGKVPGKLEFYFEGKESVKIVEDKGVREMACAGKKQLKGGVYKYKGEYIARP